MEESLRPGDVAVIDCMMLSQNTLTVKLWYMTLYPYVYHVLFPP